MLYGDISYQRDDLGFIASVILPVTNYVDWLRLVWVAVGGIQKLLFQLSRGRREPELYSLRSQYQINIIIK